MPKEEKEYVINEVRSSPDTASHAELVVYLESRGFGVNEGETTQVLRDAVLDVLNMELTS